MCGKTQTASTQRVIDCEGANRSLHTVASQPTSFSRLSEQFSFLCSVVHLEIQPPFAMQLCQLRSPRGRILLYAAIL